MAPSARDDRRRRRARGASHETLYPEGLIEGDEVVETVLAVFSEYDIDPGRYDDWVKFNDERLRKKDP